MIPTEVRGMLSLMSIPSTPVTVVSLLLGYAAATGSIITLDIVPLVIVGALGHWTFYGLNDIVDVEWDIQQGREDKPLVRGDISLMSASMICSLFGIVSIVYALYIFPKLAFSFWLAACFLGLVYDYRSKEDYYAGVYMALWGFSIIYVGALYSGRGLNGTVIILALLLGVHMLWMTIMGNLKDVGQGEKSIPERLDCKIIDDFGYKYLWTSIRFNLLANVIIIANIILMMLIPIGDGAQARDVLFVYLSAVLSVGILTRHSDVLYQPMFREENMVRDIAIYEIVSVIAILIVSVSFMDLATFISLILGSVVWGLVWQTVLYGHPLRFP